MAKKRAKSPKVIVGWREWVAIPSLGITAIKAKVDTGARSSALHAHSIEPYHKGGDLRVRFVVDLDYPGTAKTIACDAEVFDRREVRDSGGKPENRFFIRTPVEVGSHRWTVEVSLTNRSTMKFPMLLGREAIRRRATVDPGRSFLTRKAPYKRPSPSRFD